MDPSAAAEAWSSSRAGSRRPRAQGPNGAGDRDRIVRVVVADGSSVVRHGLASSLADHETLRLEATAAHGREALAVCTQRKPDVLVTGVHLARLHGVELTRQVLEVVPGCRVIGLLRWPEPATVWRALEAGIDGLICRGSAVGELLDAVEEVAAGRVYLSETVQSALVRDAIRRGAHRQGQRLDVLTAREREVAQLLVEGLTNGAIARDLHVSVKTVDSHRHHVLQKLGCRNIADLTRLAVREGMTSVES